MRILIIADRQVRRTIRDSKVPGDASDGASTPANLVTRITGHEQGNG